MTMKQLHVLTFNSGIIPKSREEDELFCVDCNVDMIEYYSEKYKGK